MNTEWINWNGITVFVEISEEKNKTVKKKVNGSQASISEHRTSISECHAELNVGSSLRRRFFSKNVLEALKWHNHRVALIAFVENQQDGLTSELQI